MKIGIIVLATNAYFPLGIRFVKRCHHFYSGEKENLVFFFFSDKNPKDYIQDGVQVEYSYVSNTNWVDGTNLKFQVILSLKPTINEDVTHLFYFDADTNVNQPFTEEWMLGDMVGGQHYADQTWMKEKKGFDRHPQSKAYVPYNTPLPQMYYYGAFFGGTTANMFSFCELMRSYQIADKAWGYEPGVNDESYINKEFHFNPPTHVVLCQNFQFAISDKGGIEDTRNTSLDVSKLLEDLKANKDKSDVNIQHGKVC